MAKTTTKTTETLSTPNAAIYFASGSNRPAEIRGFASVGQDVGVAVPELSANAEAELVALAGSSTKVFVDSGAFSEVRFGPNGREVVAPINDAEWRRRLSVYLRLGLALGSQLYVVAPDSVGDQDETLERLSRYAGVVRTIRATGANILVAIQKGRLSQAEFVRECAAVLGFSDFVHALPCKKSATTDAELEAYVAEVRPARLHLLGLGVRNRRFAGVVAALARLSPETVLFCDSCLLAASAGRTNGPGGGPRVLTASTDLARNLIAAGRSTITNAKELGIVLAFSPDGPRYRAAALSRLSA